MGEPTRTFCINHPSTRARRKCYQCLSPICPACQQRSQGHIFCSGRCQRNHWLSERALFTREFLLRLRLRARRVGRTTERLAGGGPLRILSVVLLLVLLYQTSILVAAIREVAEIGSPPAAPVYLPPSLDAHREGDTLTLSGRAPGFSMAVLLADGMEREVSTIREGRYSFSIPAGEKAAAVQVQVFGDLMPALFSRALNLRERSSESAPAAPSTRTSPTASKAPAEASRGAPGNQPQATPPVAATAPRPQNSRVAAASLGLSADLSRGNPETRIVAITFDGGSQGNAAAQILDLLDERKLKATFFLTGEFINRFPETTRRIAREGHEVGNHMFSHPHLTTFGTNLRQDTLPEVTREMVLSELRKNEELYTQVTGEKMVSLWRAPYGEQNDIIRQWAAEAGYRHVSWTYDPKTRKSLDGLDWVSDRASALYLSSDQIVKKILSFDADTEMGLSGGIVLLHLGSERAIDPFHTRLADLLDGIKKKGYRAGSVSDLLGLQKGG